MNCLGNNKSEIKKNIREGIQSIIQNNGGTLNTDNSVNLGNTNINQIKEYLNDMFGNTEGFIETAPWLVERKGKIYYQFPSVVDKWLTDAIHQKEIKDNARLETAQRISNSLEYMKTLSEEEFEKQKQGKEKHPLFAPQLVKYNNEEINAIIEDSASYVDTKGEYYGWYAQKLAVLRDLENSFKEFKRNEPKGTEYYRNKVAEYQKTILDFKDSLKDIENKSNSFEDTFSDIVQEMNYLKNVIDSMDDIEVDVYQLERRLDVLSRLLLNKTFNGQFLDSELIEKNTFLQYQDIERVKVLRADLEKMLDRFDEKSFNKIPKLLSNNALIQQLKEQSKMEVTNPKTGEVLKDDEAVNFLLEVVKDVQVNNTYGISRALLGTNWQGVFGQLARLVQEISQIEEKGKVESGQKVIRENLEEFHRSGLTVDVFKAKDEYGVQNGFLVHKFSSAWFQHKKSQENSKKTIEDITDFYIKKTAYKNWVEKKNKKELVFDFTKIKSIRDDFSGSFLYKDGFVHDENTMSMYEQELRDLLGDFLFEDCVRQQKKLLEDFEIFYINNHTRFENEVNSVNPLSFVQHFTSPQAWKDKDGLFLMDDYTLSIPKKEVKVDEKLEDSGFYSKDFQLVEENKAAFNIWKALVEAYQDRINPELRQSGYILSNEGLDIAMVEDYLKSVAYNVAESKYKVIAWLQDIWKDIVDLFMPYYIEGQNKDSVKTPYQQTLRYTAREMAKSLEKNKLEVLIKTGLNEKILEYGKKDSTKTILTSEKVQEIYNKIAELEKEIEERGKEADTSLEFELAEKAKRTLENYIDFTKKSIAQSITNNRVYSRANIDILKVTQTLDNAVAISKANRKSYDTVKLIENFLTVSAQKRPNSEKNKIEAIAKYLNRWIDSNILGNINAAEVEVIHKFLTFRGEDLTKNLKKKKEGQEKLKKSWGRSYTKVEKEFIDFIQNEVKNVADKEDFSFILNEITYEKVGNNYFEVKEGFSPEENRDVKVEKPLTKKEFEDFYAEHLSYKVSDMGTPFTLGSILVGGIRVKALQTLAFNIPSGVMNRNFGAAINRVFAASGRHGITLEQLYAARNAMSLSNIDKYLQSANITFKDKKILNKIKRKDGSYGFKIKDGTYGLQRGLRAEQTALNMRTLKLFANSFGMVQNKLNEIEGMGKFATQENFSIMDWAVNFAEWRNQGELILAEMMNHYLEYEDENGNVVKVPVYDMETEEFIYEPGTLRLKEKYRTEENIRIWENFAISSDGNNPFLPLIINARNNIERTQGNYKNDDKPTIMSSQLGRSVLMFKRFMAEQFANQFGKMDYDLVRGGKYYEGRYRVAAKYAPTTVVLLSALGFGISGSFMGMITAIPITLGASFVIRSVLKEQLRIQENEYLSFAQSGKQALHDLSELLLRVLERPADAVVRVTEMANKEKNLRKGFNKAKEWSYGGVDKLNQISNEKDKAVVSESIQDFANLYWAMGVAMTSIIVLRFIGEILTGADDDDDEKEYAEKMKTIEGMTNLLVNRYGFFTGDFTRSFYRKEFEDEVRPMLLNNIKAGERMVTKGKAFLRGEGDLLPVFSDAQRALPTLIPNVAWDWIVKKGNSPVTDPKIYDKPWWYSEGHPETDAKRAVKHQREKLTEEMVDVYKKHFIEQLEAMPETFQNNFADGKYKRNKKIEELANTAVEKEKRKLYRRKNQETFQEFYDRVDLKKERKKWRKGEIKPKYNFREIYNQEQDKEKDRQKEREKYEREFLR